MTESLSILAELIAKAASDKKANDIIILDMQGISMVTDHYIIASAKSNTQVKAIADNIEEKLQEQGYPTLRKEGYREGNWILLDHGNCVTHIFIEEDRLFYNLERLWRDAPVHHYEN